MITFTDTSSLTLWMWIEVQLIHIGKETQGMHDKTLVYVQTGRPEAQVSHRAPADLGEQSLKTLSKWEVVRLSLVCNKGSFAKAA